MSETVSKFQKPEVILQLIADQFGIRIDQITGYNRYKSILFARKASYLIFRRLGYSYPEIARIHDRLNHTTVLKVIPKAEGLYRDDTVFREQVDFIYSLVKR